MIFLAKRRSLVLAATAILVFGSFGLAQDAIRMGTSSVGSVFYTLAIGAGELAHKHAGLNVTVEPVGGSAANVNGIAAGNIDIALTISFAAVTGYFGTEAFSRRGPIDLRLIAQGSPSYRHIFVREGSGISTPADFEGKTIIAERRALPELRLMMDAFIRHYELDADSIQVVATTNSGESIAAIRAGSVDAIVMPFGTRAAQVNEPMADGVMRMLKISEADRDAILNLLPSNFLGTTLAPNEFSNQPEAIPLFYLNAYLIASPNVAEDLVYKFAKSILENAEEYATYHPAGRQWTPQRSLQKPGVPFHPGAIKYYQETGMWNADLAAQQARLLRR